jgi:cellulose synthase/poly-beta-1,6-N-acetylglucosamine synthase-like glycosyltransferase
MKPQLSIIITAWKEQDSIGKCIYTLVQDLDIDFELLLGCPDIETYTAAKQVMDYVHMSDKLKWVQDPGKGKPYALNLLMDQAQGEIWLFGDGDTYFGEEVVAKLLKHLEDPQVQAVTGRPISQDDRGTMMEYYGHLLTDAADHKRRIDLGGAGGRSSVFVKKRPFFPVSGYLFAMRATALRPPADCLVEDAYFSYSIHNAGGKINYEPEAQVFVKFPKTLSDYFKQKKRSVGGYVQLWKYGIVKPETNTRSFGRELEYFWFPIRYAQNARELIWSLLLYPIRAWLWLRIFWERRILHKDFSKTWVRIESTK